MDDAALLGQSGTRNLRHVGGEGTPRSDFHHAGNGDQASKKNRHVESGAAALGRLLHAGVDGMAEMRSVLPAEDDEPSQAEPEVTAEMGDLPHVERDDASREARHGYQKRSQ